MKNELSLYDLVGKVEYYQNIFDCLDNNHSLESESLKEEAIKELFESEKGLARKTESIIQFIDFCESQADKANEVIERAKARKKSYENLVERIKSYLKYVMTESGQKKLESEVGNISIRNNAASCELKISTTSKSFSNVIAESDLNLVPQEFITKSEVYTIDKNAIKKAISEGNFKALQIAELKQSQSIIIK